MPLGKSGVHVMGTAHNAFENISKQAKKGKNYVDGRVSIYSYRSGFHSIFLMLPIVVAQKVGH
jgi:hypothetical protein